MMKTNTLRAALAIALAGAAMPAVSVGSERVTPRLMALSNSTDNRPPRRAGQGVRAGQRRAIKARNVARNRRAHR